MSVNNFANNFTNDDLTGSGSNDLYGSRSRDQMYNVFNKEKDVVDKINTFYKKYHEYLRCINCNLTNNTCNTDKCNVINEELDKKYQELIDSMNNMDTSLNGLNINGNRTIPTTEDYEKTYNRLKTDHGSILNLRNELDEKLNYINNVKNSYSDIHANQYNSSIYTGILMSILATTMLYYVFIKL